MLKNINIYLYKSPGVNKKVAEGILLGIDEFLKSKTKFKPAYKVGDWKTLDKKKRLNVFFTKNSLTKSKITKDKHLEGNIIFRTKEVNDLRRYKENKLNANYLRALRGIIAGYNELAKLFNLDCCNADHCIFNFEKKDLDNLAFLLHLNKEIPLCEYHKGWNVKK